MGAGFVKESFPSLSQCVLVTRIANAGVSALLYSIGPRYKLWTSLKGRCSQTLGVSQYESFPTCHILIVAFHIFQPEIFVILYNGCSGAKNIEWLLRLN